MTRIVKVKILYLLAQIWGHARVSGLLTVLLHMCPQHPQTFPRSKRPLVSSPQGFSSQDLSGTHSENFLDPPLYVLHRLPQVVKMLCYQSKFTFFHFLFLLQARLSCLPTRLIDWEEVRRKLPLFTLDLAPFVLCAYHEIDWPAPCKWNA